MTRRLACLSPVAVLNALVWPLGWRRATGVAYGADPRQRLDIYRPDTDVDTKAPVVMFLYGGSWEEGSRAMYLFVGAALAARGFVVVIPDYRVWPQVGFPDFLVDNAAALRWTKDNAAQHGGDPSRLLLLGHSAGAYNAAMLALDPRWLATAGLSPTILSGMIGLAGPYDFLPITDPTIQRIFGPRDQWPATQPITYASAAAPPLFLAAGTDDTTVDPANTTRLAARITQLGGRVQTRLYPGIDHRMLIGSFAGPLRFTGPVLRDCTAWLHAAARLPVPAQ